MHYVYEFFSNRVLMTALLGWVVAQVLKVIIVLFKDKRFDLRRMVGSGGMPSSHSSFVMSLTTAVAFESGLMSPLFAVCAVLSFVVMYDASGVRRETGRQAVILNDIIDIIENIGKDEPEVFGKRLKELIGHSPVEVAVGAVLGIAIGLFMYALL